MFGFSRKPAAPAPTSVPEPADSRPPGNAPIIPPAYIGEIRQFAFSHTPLGWHPCDGTNLEIRDNMALYAAIGPQFGGDGVNTFALPTIPPTRPGIVSCIAIKGFFPSRE